MVKKLSKSRRSAILEHLLALEKQIRVELGGDNLEERTSKSKRMDGIKGSLSSTRHDEHGSEDRDRTISQVISARFTH